MQYDLTEEQVLLQNMVRRLSKEKVAPGAGGRDEDGEFDWQMVDLLRENGLYGIDFPEAYGGSGAGLLALAIAIEELSKVDASCGILIADHELGSLPILLAASEAQKSRYLPKLATGRAYRCLCLDGTRSRFRCGTAALPCPERRRLLPSQRHQELHHQWRSS